MIFSSRDRAEQSARSFEGVRFATAFNFESGNRTGPGRQQNQNKMRQKRVSAPASDAEDND